MRRIPGVSVVEDRKVLRVFKVERRPVPFRVLEHHALEIALGDNERLAYVAGPVKLATWLVAGPELLPGGRILQPIIDFLDRVHLSCREAVRGVVAFAQKRRRIKFAQSRIFK